MDYFVHETSIVEEGAEIGEGTKIWHFSHIMENSKIGRNCNLGQNVVVSPGVVMGDSCKVQNNVSVYTGVILEDGVFLGPSCVFTNVINPRAFIERKAEYRKTIIKRGASIGANSTIVCGNQIGEYALVGAGALVTKDVSPYEIVVGNPARHFGYICSCGERIYEEEDFICKSCGKKYSFDKSGHLKEEK